MTRKRSTKSRRKGSVKLLLDRAAWVVAALAAATMLFSAYGGMVDPRHWALPALFTLALPIVAICAAAMAILLLVFRARFQALLVLVAMCLSGGPLLSICPLSMGNRKTGFDERLRTAKVMTFNAIGFEYRNKFCAEQCEPVDYILEESPDVVCLQEGELDFTIDQIVSLRGEPLKQLKSTYPHRTPSVYEIGLWSKHPFKVVCRKKLSEGRYGIYEHYQLKLCGRNVDLVNVHLESLGLSPDDKSLYMQYTHPDKYGEKLRSLDKVRHTIVSKLASAYRIRAAQAQEVRDSLDTMGENVIICGDFNDTPSSWAYRTIMGDDLTDCYRDCAFGPTITYHENRFYFRIDHVMCRGSIVPRNVHLTKRKISDHYPLTFSLVFTD